MRALRRIYAGARACEDAGERPPANNAAAAAVAVAVAAVVGASAGAGAAGNQTRRDSPRHGDEHTRSSERRRGTAAGELSSTL